MSTDTRGNNSNQEQQSQQHQTQDTSRESSTTKTRNHQGPEAMDNMTLSEMAAQLKSLEHELAKQPEVDQNHINRVRDAIKRGEYQVIPDRIAGKMMGFDEDH
jgi:flagellar biosynthesis anti-sigma factor FlgM